VDRLNKRIKEFEGLVAQHLTTIKGLQDQISELNNRIKEWELKGRDYESRIL